MEQLRIAVCDDVEADREHLIKDLQMIWGATDIISFDDGKELLGQIQKGIFFDLIFLDIIMPQDSGIEIGKKIHQFYPDTEIVYVSSSREFGPEAFETDALHYLVKPYQIEHLQEVSRRFRRMKEKKAVVHLKSGGQEIPFHMMGYIESAHNNLVIHLINGNTFTIRSSLMEFMDTLDERFLRINRGVIVNMEAIDKMGAESCEVMGMTFMLGRKDRAENRKQYREWLFQTALEGGER